jgi:hypothetical protein
MDKPKPLYRFAVSHPDYEGIEVIAKDPPAAVYAAAKAWGVQKWTSIALMCQITRLGLSEGTATDAKPKKPTPKRAAKAEAGGENDGQKEGGKV